MRRQLRRTAGCLVDVVVAVVVVVVLIGVVAGARRLPRAEQVRPGGGARAGEEERGRDVVMVVGEWVDEGHDEVFWEWRGG